MGVVVHAVQSKTFIARFTATALKIAINFHSLYLFLETIFSQR